ncbi:hypothetical protein ACHAQH_007263 [Verticillium albo-atrum]
MASDKRKLADADPLSDASEARNDRLSSDFDVAFYAHSGDEDGIVSNNAVVRHMSSCHEPNTVANLGGPVKSMS